MPPKEVWEDALKPLHPPAWHPGNFHEVIMARSLPPPRFKPKDPTPTLNDLKPKNDSRLRCFNQAFQQDLLRIHETADKENSSSSILKSARNNSLSGRESSSVKLFGEEKSVHYEASKQRKETLEATRNHDDIVRTDTMLAKMQRLQTTKEAQFQATYRKLQAESETFVKDLDKYLDEKQKAHVQKRRALYTEWKECVFDKIQDQIVHKLEEVNGPKLAARNRELFQNYIDAARRKGGRLFLDIVIANEYDPFTWKKDTLRYRDKPATVSNGPGFTDRFGNPVSDPVKRDLEKLKTESRAAQEVGGGSDSVAKRLGRETLGHEHWSKMEATPFYDRAAKVQDAIAAGKNPPVRSGMQSKVDLDDYAYPTGPAELTKEFQGLYGRGKRVWLDWQPGGNVYAAPSDRAPTR